MTDIKIEGCTLAILPISDIDEGMRFREDYGDLTDLIHSIRTQGVISPIAVRPTSNNRYLLIAGGRRLRASKEAGLEVIPTRIFTKELTELELRVLELAENIQRKDMGWMEEAKLKREIHLLQQKIHGKPTPGPSEAKGWSVEDTASMLGISRTSAGQAIALAENIEKLSGVVDFSKMKSAKEAGSVINNISEAVLRKELVKRAERKKEAEPFLQALYNSFIISDVFEGMSKLPDESFDCVILDPPYGIVINDTKKENDCETYTEVEQKKYLLFMEQVLKETFRLQKPNTFCVCWFGIEPWFEYIYNLGISAGYSGNRIVGVWTKPNGQSLNPSTQLASAFEPFFIFKKGAPILAKPGRTNVFSFSPVPPQRKYHPTQKPLELASEIIQTFSFESSKILVPFLGSGVDILASASCNRAAVGFDLAEEHKGGFIKEAQAMYGATF